MVLALTLGGITLTKTEEALVKIFKDEPSSVLDKSILTVWRAEGPFDLEKHIKNNTITVYPAKNFSTFIQDFKEFNYKG